MKSKIKETREKNLPEKKKKTPYTQRTNQLLSEVEGWGSEEEDGVGLVGIFWIPYVVAIAADPHCIILAITMVKLNKI